MTTDPASRADGNSLALDPTFVLIPVKAFSRAKVRLAPDISSAERQALARRMATSVVQAAAPLPVAVVCDDPEVADWVEEVGARLLWTPGTGLNGAVRDGVNRLAESGVEHVVVAHSDLPLARTFERVAGWPGVTIVPDRHRTGSNVVAVPTTVGFRFAYGTNSYRRHVAEAMRVGRGLRIVHEPSLAWDVDYPGDLNFPAQ